MADQPVSTDKQMSNKNIQIALFAMVFGAYRRGDLGRGAAQQGG